MVISNQTVWVIMTKNRKYIAKGVPRNRYMVSVDDIDDTKRYLTYSSKGKAEAGFKISGFYFQHLIPEDEREFEAVPVNISITTLG